MAGTFGAKSDELTELIKDLGVMHDSIEGKIRTLNGVIDAIEGHWKGVAAGEYNALQERVNRDVARIKEMLAFTKEAMSASRDGFDEHEIERLNAWKGVDASVPGGLGSNGVLDRFQAS
ncbi:WXG100 family type VII secretion target [Streptomyces sp. LX-29]|uniref:WXG100 family type VII secretion target n=1 Tax=Streptomyces sp. LX-29 TaxID=2900152 RepID=UPI00240E8743|nr:WXG100 family type VII secretion target [Streptomyces sp. LX-29]WFB07112.1 WXG100 family type VII secretion target [Streptomyces sp. LX-29]